MRYSAGYQRELTYRHTDGSYSAFGNNDDSGSMWLTSFVLKSFAQAQSLIYIDADDLTKTVDWVLSQQLENGCFPKVRVRTLYMYNTSPLYEYDHCFSHTLKITVQLYFTPRCQCKHCFPKI